MDFLRQNRELATLLNVALAMLLGAIIGLERELENKPAGLRTHMLVAGSATLFVSLGSVLVESYIRGVGGAYVRADPVRIVQATIIGVSFLGAGTIFFRRTDNYIEGLTTAASILFTTALSVSVALSQFILAVGATVLVLITLHFLGKLEVRFERRRREEPCD
ncbi:MAG: MgtC/SapB family protein [Anaerolineales bacterium]